MSALLRVAPCAAVLIIGLVTTTSLVLKVRDPQRVVALLPPWWTPDARLEAVASAGAFIAWGAIPVLAFVAADDPGLPDRLRAAGALAVFDGSGAIGCLGLRPANNPTRRSP